MLIDLVVVLVVALAAWGGWRRGGVSTVVRLACAGVGLALGLLGAGLLSSRVSPVAHVLLGVVCAAGGLLIGSALGRRMVRRTRAPGLPDRIAGVVVRGVLAAVTCGLAASFVLAFGPSAWATAIRAAPLAPSGPGDVPVAGRVWDGVAGVLRSAAPGDLAALVPSTTATGPDAATVAAVDAAAGERVLPVSVRLCGRDATGTGFVVGQGTGGGLVVTNAHVVRGAGEVSIGGRTATVVAYDARADLAVLFVPGLDVAPLTLAAADAANGAALVVVGYPGGGGRRAIGASVIVRIPTPNPGFTDGAALHEAYRLRADVQHGNSGSPLLDTSGRVVGVVNALTGTDGTQGYAITLDELRPIVQKATGHTTAVAHGTCS